MTLDQEYLAAQIRAIKALETIQAAINDEPSPGGEHITWGKVANMHRIATDLEIVVQYAR